MTVTPQTPHIERKPNSDKYRVVGKGVTVEFLSQFIGDSEWPVDRICENYNLTPAEVHSAWAFYYDHRDEIDARIAATQQADAAHEEESRHRSVGVRDISPGELSTNGCPVGSCPPTLFRRSRP